MAMFSDKIRIRLKAYDSRILDQSTGEIVETVEAQAGTLRGARSTLPLGVLLADFPVVVLVREAP